MVDHLFSKQCVAGSKPAGLKLIHSKIKYILVMTLYYTLRYKIYQWLFLNFAITEEYASFRIKIKINNEE